MLTPAQRNQLQQGTAAFGLALPPTTLDQFARIAELLEEGNKRLNLTRIAPEDVVTHHLIDSLALAAVMTPKPGARLLDVGTGAGFPGIPLALAYPDLRVTLLDGTRKRLAFLDEVIAEIGLKNVVTLHGRAEELAANSAHRGAYDIVTARAVAKLERLAGWMLPLVRPGGVAVAYKSQDIDAEVAAARSSVRALSGKIERIAEVRIPGTDIVRKLVLLRKHVTVKG